MMSERDWLWDRKISLQGAKAILRKPDSRHFLSLASILLARKNTPREVFKLYLKPIDFLRNWQRIKKQMRKDRWNNPRIEFWQAIYEVLKEKYKGKGVDITKEAYFPVVEDELCKTVANSIKDVRKAKKLTQSALAKKLKVSQQLISRIETGRENISLSSLKKITDALGVKLQISIEDEKTVYSLRD